METKVCGGEATTGGATGAVKEEIADDRPYFNRILASAEGEHFQKVWRNKLKKREKREKKKKKKREERKEREKRK
jgi:hypothetical protein